jgi:S-adenosylmethionine:tRNA ribosyltransferase-isomerase
MLRTADFDFSLPQELIAQTPAPERTQSRLLVLRRENGSISHEKFPDLLSHLNPGDLLVLNNSRVIPARLRGVNPRTGGQFEALLLEDISPRQWWAMLRPGKRARVGTEIEFSDADEGSTKLAAKVLSINEDGHRLLEFDAEDVLSTLEKLGEVPLPPYINRNGRDELAGDKQRYQTVYAGPPGSVAAPTAGLHFTQALLEKIRARGVRTSFVTLHVGPGTFAPVKTETLDSHIMHEERFALPEETVRAMAETKAAGKKVFAVGTTAMRVLESVAREHDGSLVSGSGRTRIFIHPPFRFQVVDGLLTNFHLPKSTLLMLVSAFASPGETRGREMVLRAYEEAVRERYRFFSYGDAMLVV